MSSAEATHSWFLWIFAAFGRDAFLKVFGKGSTFLISQDICCLWPWRASSGLWQRQHILDFSGYLLPLTEACFLGSLAVAAHPWFLGTFAAFDRGVFLRVSGKGSTFLISWDICCLWPRRVSSGLWQRQQTLDFSGYLLPLTEARFWRSLAKATNSWFLGIFSALDRGEQSFGLRQRQLMKF